MIGLQNSKVLYFDQSSYEENVDIVIEDSKIIDVGRNILIKYPQCQIIEKDGLVTPGIVCSHSHIYSALARGLNVKIKPAKDFVQTLQNLWWILDKSLDKDMVIASAQVSAIEAILCGVTTIIDHHSSPNFIEGSLKTIKDCFEKIGIRSILCYETTDRNGIEKAKEAIYENQSFADFIDEEKKKKNERLTEASIGAHAPFTLSDESLNELSKICETKKRGLHLHVCEDRFESSFSRFMYGLDPIKRLDKFSLITNKSIIAHGVYISEDEIEIINKKDAFLIHNPRSNMNNNVGYNEKLYKYKNVAIGTDGINHDLIMELATSFFKYKDNNKGYSFPLSTQDFLSMFNNGNKILERYFDGMKFGKIEKGYTADLVIFDYNSPTRLNSDNLGSHMIFGFNSGFVRTVVVNGKVVLKDRKFDFNIRDIFENAQKQAERLAKNMENYI